MALSKAERWERLKPSYRNRLERGGYTRADYLTGRSRVALRGHRETPEHPERADKPSNAGRYGEYRQRRADAVAHIGALLIPLIQTREINDFDWTTVENNMSRTPMRLIRRILGYTEPTEFRMMASRQPSVRNGPYDGEDAIQVNGYWVNPFWYH